MLMWCGIDWAEHHHDVAIIDEGGHLRARLRIADDAAGFIALLELLATHRLDATADIPVAIETRQRSTGGEPARRRDSGVRDQPAVGGLMPATAQGVSHPL